MSPETIDKINWLVSNPNESIRIPANDWDDILLANENRIVCGAIRYFQALRIGLGVYKMKFLPVGWESEFGTIELDPKTDWITNGTRLVLKKNKTCGGC
jgi:hypothetical protein